MRRLDHPRVATRYLAPCLAVVLIVLAPAAAAAGARAERTEATRLGALIARFDLETGYVDGRRVLGRTVAGVTAALGRPDYRRPGTSHYAIGFQPHPPFFIEVRFLKKAGKLRAASIIFQDLTLEESRMGRVLRLGARQIQTAIEREYQGEYVLVRTYGCRKNRFCSGEFKRASKDLRVTFGRAAGGARFINVWTR